MTTQQEHVELICCASPRAECTRLPSRPRTWLVGLLLLLCAAGAQAAPAFPVKYSADKRYLVDQAGTPFPILGRTAWFVVSLPVIDYKTFIDDTVARGYTAIELHVLNHDPRGNRPPFNGNGDAPFLKRLDGTAWDGTLSGYAPDFTTPNEAYWSFVDGLLAYCESKGVLVFMFPAYVGYQGGDQGWMQEMVANGSARMRSYGAWIAARYANQKNLVWMMGGDMGSFNSAQQSAEDGLLAGLKSVAGQQSTLFSAEWSSEMIATDQATFGSSMTLNGVYSFTGYVNAHGRRAYGHSPVEPAFLLEEPYDQEGPDGNGVNENATQPVRRFQWWGWLSTIGGYISGNGYVWPFNAPDWRNHLDTQGSRDMARLNAFIVSIPWYSLVPSGLGGVRTLITAGGSTDNEYASDYVAASATPQGTLLVAYIPPDHSGSITVDMGAMSGPSRARWFDPTSGTYTSIGSGLVNSGTREFTPPGSNSVGQTDWTLVLDTAGTAGAPSDTAGAPSPPSDLRIVAPSQPSNEISYTAPAPTPTPTATPTPGVTNIGETTVLSTADNGNGNLLVAQQATLPVTSVLQSMSFYVTNAAGKLRLGVYDASGPGGGPGNKVAETGEITPTVGWNEANVIAPVYLPSGAYWLAYLASDNNLAFVKTLSGQANYYTYSYGPMPESFSSSSESKVVHWSLFANLSTLGIEFPTHLLTVINGTGTGDYTEGTRVTVSANAPASGQEFDRWTGDWQILDNPLTPTTTALMLFRDLAISANYRSNDTIRYLPLAGFGDRMVGGVFEGTNGDPVEGPYTPIYTITATPPDGWSEVSVSLGSYRYLRYRGAPGSYCTVVEIQFYRAGGKLEGTGYGSPGSWVNSGSTFDKALDGDSNTFFNGPAPDGNYVGIDTSGAVSNGKIRFYPRRDHTDRMIRGVFEGTNGDPVNGPYDAIYTIASNPPLDWNEVSVDLKDYRYLRYRGPTDSFGNVAEIEFYRNGVKLSGIGFGTPGSWSNQGSTFDKAFDGNPGTFFDASINSGAYVGIDTR